VPGVGAVNCPGVKMPVWKASPLPWL